jgi:protein involved in polysaccharide export with SLBB domain
MNSFQLIAGKGLLALLLLSALVGCSPLSDVTAGPNPASLPACLYEEPYAVAPLDQIVITRKSGAPVVLKITTDTPVEYPEGRPLKVIGRTPDEVTTVLKKRDSSITLVTVDEFRGNRVTVTGEVNIQTNFDLQDSPMRALDAIASAGGFTPLADSSGVRLTRHNAGKVEVFQLDLHAAQRGSCDYLNILLEPGDRIYVPRSFL